MKQTLITVALTAGLALTALAEPKKVLVVTTTTGFRHSSIPTAEKILGMLAEKSGAFTVDYVHQPEGKPNLRRPNAPKPDANEAAKAKYKEELAKYEADAAAAKPLEAAWNEKLKQELSKLSKENLKKYDAVIFANTTGDLPLPDPQAFIDWVKEGHGFVGMHSASDTFHKFPPYLDMLGGEFETHKAQVSVDAINQDSGCAACKHLSANWTVFDEIYIIKNFNRSTMHGLLTLNAHPNTKVPGDYPIAWKKDFGKGRVFYTSLGHREDLWDTETPENFKRSNSKENAEAYQKHILGGIRWALGLENCDAKPQGK